MALKKQPTPKPALSSKVLVYGISSFIAIAAIILGVMGIEGIEDIESSNLHSSPVCGAEYSSYNLNWGTSGDTYDWSPGSLSKNISFVDGSETSVRVSFSGETSKLSSLGTGQTPNVQTFFSGGDHDALSLYTFPGFTGSGITITFDISPAIPATMAFDLYHINGSSYSGDKLEIYAVTETGGINIHPTFIDNGSPSWEREGNNKIDAIQSSTSNANAYAGVEFNDNRLVNQLVLVWTNCDICGGGEHGIGIGAIEFCSKPAPDTDQDNIPDHLDIDDDNDGIPDEDEFCLGNTASGTGEIEVIVALDGYPTETNWVLKKDGVAVLNGDNYTTANQVITETYTGPNGEYEFYIFDSYGDGLCCNSPGYYEISTNGESVSGVQNWISGSFDNYVFSLSPSDFSCIAGDPSADDDSDGIVNYKDGDFCTLNSFGVCSELDADNDGIINSLDLDSDNDGISDLVEAKGADQDGDGRADVLTDTDEDGLVDAFDNDDSDGPAVTSCIPGRTCDLSGSTSTMFDTNGDGSNNEDGDFDGDDLPNWLDLDSDDDGITDITEAGGTDTNSDGQVDYASPGDASTMVDADEDGFMDGVDGDPGNDDNAENTANVLIITSADSDGDGIPNGSYPRSNTDSNGLPDFLDIDADDDGITDNTEAQTTADYQSPSDQDSDNDGIDDAYDNVSGFGGAGLSPTNTDSDGTPDYQDLNSDNDDESDLIEGHDTDGDGSANSQSPAGTGVATGADSDGDGLDDGFDNDLSSSDPTNGSLSPTSFPKFDSGLDRDWRDINSSSLPVEWSGFEGEWQGGMVSLNWRTAMESNSDFFGVERSQDGRVFEQIGSVDAIGNATTETSYDFLDRNPGNPAGNVVYYRLKQVDINGNFDYSSTINLSLDGSVSEYLTAYPNPVAEVVTVEFNWKESIDANLSIYNMAGQEVYQQPLRVGNKEAQINMGAFNKGGYVIVLRAGNTVLQKRIEKQ